MGSWVYMFQVLTVGILLVKSHEKPYLLDRPNT